MHDADNSMTTMELEYVEGVVDFMLWDTPTSLLPTEARVRRLVEELKARPDAGCLIVQAALAECDRFFEMGAPLIPIDPDDDR